MRNAGRRYSLNARFATASMPARTWLAPACTPSSGAKAGSVPGYVYSPAMKNANVTWTDDTLSKYLSDPKAFIPGDKMAFAGVKDPSKLRDLLAYLNQATR